MTELWHCIGFGLCVFDYLAIVERYPRLNQKIDAIDYSQQGGGPVATAMATLGRLGAKRLAIVGKIGDDEEGKKITDALEQDGVDTSFLKVVPGIKSPQAFVWIERKSGKRSVVLHRDKKLLYKQEEIEPEPLKHTKYLLIDGRDTDAALQVARIVKQYGGHIVMDAGSLRPKMEDFFQLVDYFICSKDFVYSYGGNDPVELIMKKIHDFGCKWVVVTMGEKGSIGFDGLNIVQEPAFPVDVMDTTGAGDVFHGAFIYGLLHNWTLQQNLYFSNAVAACKCQKLGGRLGIPTLDIVKHYLNSQTNERFFKNWL